MKKQFLCLTLACALLLGAGCSAGNGAGKRAAHDKRDSIVVEETRDTKKKTTARGRIKSIDGLKLTLETTAQSAKPAKDEKKPQAEKAKGDKAQKSAAKNDKPKSAPEKPDKADETQVREYVLSQNARIEGADALAAEMVVTLEFDEDGSVKTVRIANGAAED